jgi:dTDP-4-amino-4,6-dideoxygalactose transaminase
MPNKFKPISISLSPNVEKDDVLLALNLLIRPWKWKQGKEIEILEKEFANYLGVKHAVSFNSGRSSLYAILKALSEVEGLKSKDSILLQAFTCNAAINPALWLGLNPVYVDCSQENFNMNIEDLKKKIDIQKAQGKPAKVLMVQHTFGLPANMDEIVKIAKENNLILIEDCAHALGAEFSTKKVGLPTEALAKVGTFGKAGFFSFSRDKVISCVYGGMAVTNDDNLARSLRQAQGKFSQPSLFWIKQQLLHPILLYYFILPFYNFFNLGKIILVFTQVSHILSKAVSWKEKKGQMPDYFPKALPNALAILALNQFAKLDKFYNHRKKLFEYYAKELAGSKFVLPKIETGYKASYLRFTVKHPDAHKIIYDSWHLPRGKAGKENILLGDWYTTVIAPFDTKLETMNYKNGSCLNAEILSQITLNLPTHINIKEKDAERIVNFLKNYK